ncbi:MAG: hypothetical protein EOM64_03705 [Erysipelotrichia bacterium]|nr:hypothetical protein [Erysipelotrichia bacterium]
MKIRKLLNTSIIVALSFSSAGTAVLAEESTPAPTSTPVIDAEGEFIGDVNYDSTAFENNYLDEQGTALDQTAVAVKTTDAGQETVATVPAGLSVINTLGDSVWSRAVSTMISVYAKRGTCPSASVNIDAYDDLIYHYMIVTPTDSTFVQLDYSGDTPKTLNNFVDTELTNGNYWFIGSINGGFFTNSDEYPGYGYPTGAVRCDSTWQTWTNSSGESYDLIPDHNGGYVTAYWTGADMVLSYNGWDRSLFNQWGQIENWFGDITRETSYQNALSGSYSLFANGEEINLSPVSAMATSVYWNYSRSVTLFAQLTDGRYVLLTTEGTCRGDEEIALLKHVAERENSAVEDAVRLDGGGSTQMCFDKGLVKVNISDDAKTAIGANDADAIGTVTVMISNLNIRKTPNLTGGILGAASKSTYHVFETKEADGYTWYRIRANQWIASNEGEWTVYKAN